ncbi:MAG: thiosulfate oxidation carrier complex protein SoxZ [Gammaproteobacteria bacterium]|nr:thiosulfate oxidation carrier complex protein SoxZ [Gammaproteobacteria bacterium]
MSTTIKVRAMVSADIATVKAIINHPMTVERLDKATGKVVPAHFIEEVVFSHNGEELLVASCGQAISKNPYFSFKFSGARSGDTLGVIWRDNQGKQDRDEFQIR